MNVPRYSVEDKLWEQSTDLQNAVLFVHVLSDIVIT